MEYQNSGPSGTLNSKHVYRDLRFILLLIIKILQQMTLQQTFIMSRFLFTSELFKIKH